MSPETTARGPDLPVADRRRIDAACDRFEDAWLAAGPQDLAAFLESDETEEFGGPARDRLFLELLALELKFLRDRGERPALEEYRERFPEFLSALDSAATLATDDPDQTRDPDETLGSGEGPPDGGPGRVGPDTDEVLRSAGYEVVRELGRGGMGVVYEARQQALNRVVAVKLIRSAEFASETERRRFRNEAEAVAQLDHPHIVPIFEVRRHRGHDFFSMKMVAGTSLEKTLGAYAADPRAAARVAATAAEAVHHAHRRGILHRDLKPANILIDEAGSPHITDFGLAKRVDDADAELTQSGTIVGTPSYMSPEQAGGLQGELTVATDVYGLGSIFYALLTGRSPYAGSGLLETLERVRQEPPTPPSKLNPRVPRDLEVICLKCLEKEPGRRYADAQALADDLGRFLDGEPIAARPVRALTRTWMWCRRHPLPASLAGALALALAGGFAGVAWQGREAARQRDAAEATVAFLADDLLGRASPAITKDGKDTTIGALLDFAAKAPGGKLADQPAALAKVREALGEAYLALGESAAAVNQFREASRLEAGLYGPAARATLRTEARLASAMVAAERERRSQEPSWRDPEAEPMVRRVLVATEQTQGPNDPTTLEATAALGALLRGRGAVVEAEPFLRRALDGRRRVLPADHGDTLRSMLELSLLLRDRGQVDEAEGLARQYEHDIRCSRGAGHPDNVPALSYLASLRQRQGKDAEALQLLRDAAENARRIFGREHPRTQAAEAELAQAQSRAAPPARSQP